MVNRLKNTTLFFVPYLIMFGLSICFYFYQGHGDFVLWINSIHHPILDMFFRYWTYTGSAVFFVLATILVLVYNQRFGLVLSMVGIGVSLVSIFFKQVLFPHVPRPTIFLDKQSLFLVDGVEILSFGSFPSGHTMAAFALASFMALKLQNNKLALLLFVGATLTGLSRIYLSHHFLIDVMAGSLMGIIIATACYLSFEKYLYREMDDRLNTADRDLAEMDLGE